MMVVMMLTLVIMMVTLVILMVTSVIMMLMATLLVSCQSCGNPSEPYIPNKWVGSLKTRKIGECSDNVTNQRQPFRTAKG